MARKVLVVDDEPFVCKMLRKFLERKDCSVEEAYSGDEALEVYRQMRPDVVLLDIRMPGKDGLKILRELKTLDPGATVIMVTAVRDDKSGIEAMKHGADSYVTKPIDADFLWDVVDAKIILRTVRWKAYPGSGKEDSVNN